MNEEIVFNDVKVTTHPDGLFIRENGHVVFLTWEEIQRVSDIAKLATA